MACCLFTLTTTNDAVLSKVGFIWGKKFTFYTIMHAIHILIFAKMVEMSMTSIVQWGFRYSDVRYPVASVYGLFYFGTDFYTLFCHI